jgi:hypothetical protein
MTFTERDLRDTLHADAGPEPLAMDDGWSDVVERCARRRRDRRVVVAAAAVMLVAVATTTTVVVLAQDDEGVQLTPPPVSTPAPTVELPTTLARGDIPEPARDGCSASNWPMSTNSPEEIDSFATLGTPEATAAYIQAKATACDYEALRTVMADDFQWSTVEPPGADAAVTAWRLQEAHGQSIMYNVVALLRTAVRGYDPTTGMTTWTGSPQTSASNARLEIDDRGIWRSFTLP